MQKKISATLYLIFIFFVSRQLSAQNNLKDVSISVTYSYTNVAKMFLYPHATSVLLRESYVPFNDIFSYAGELRYTLTESVILGLRVEYMKETEFGRNLTDPRFIVEDGFEIIPVELSAYYYLPFSTQDFKFFMGGGFGVYFGKHLRKFGDATLEKVSQKFAYGIQVQVGMDYLITDFLSTRFEMRFRDPEVEVTSKYSQEIVKYNDLLLQLDTNNFDTRINVNGVTFTLGMAINFDLPF